MNLTGEFQTDVFNLVSSPRFGSYQKSDLNLLLFHYALREVIQESGMHPKIEPELVYYILNRQNQNRLSEKLKIPISSIKVLIEKAASIYGRIPSHKELMEIIKPLIERCQISQHWYKNGYVGILVHNKILKELIITRLDEGGGIVDYSFNQDILRIPAFDLLKLIGQNETQIIDSFLQKAKNHNKLNEKKKDEIAKKVNQTINVESKKEVVKSVVGFLGQNAPSVLAGCI